MSEQPRTAVITGGGRGMGAEIATTLAAAGWLPVIGGRSGSDLQAVVDRVRAAGGDAVHRIVDVAEPGEVQALVDAALERTGRLDAAVANAGYAVNALIADGDPADWDRMIDVNLRGVLHLMAAAAPVLRRQGGGHFVTIGSTSAAKWVSTQGVYAATKAAARAATDVLRQELAPDGARVTFLSPGFTATGFVDSTRDPEERAALQRRRDAIAMPPRAVADAVAWVLEQPAGVDVGELTIRSTAQP